MRSIRRSGFSTVTLALGLLVLCGCGSVRQIRIENVSTRDFTNVSIAGQHYGDIAPGEITDYKEIETRLRYAAMKLHVDGEYMTAQSLNFGSRRFTYRIDVKNFDAGHLEIDVVKDKPSNDSK